MKSSIMQIKKFILSKKAVLGSAVLLLLVSAGGAMASYRSAHSSTQGNNTSQSALNQYQNNKNSDGTTQGGEEAQAGQPLDPGTNKNTGTKTKTATVKTATSQSAAVVNTDCLIKAKTVAKTGKKLFYLPNDSSYSKVKATECFKTADEAVAAGYQNASQK
jgi:hypothetical protein